MNKTKILGTAALLCFAVVLAFSPITQKAIASSFSTVSFADPLPVQDGGVTAMVPMASSTYNTSSLLGPKTLRAATGGYIPVGTKTLRIFAASGAFHIGDSTTNIDSTSTHPHVAADAYYDLKVNPMDPNATVVYLSNVATNATSLVRFIAIK